MKLLALLALAVGLAYAATATFTVTVEEAKVRKTKAHYAPSVAVVHYGDKVKAGEPEDGWHKVSVGGASGWLHASALGSKSLKATAGDWEGGAQASADEVTLAGKGFNAEVEKSYRQNASDVDYAAVDAMEKRSVSDETLVKFMKTGKTLPGGAQ